MTIKKAIVLMQKKYIKKSLPLFEQIEPLILLHKDYEKLCFVISVRLNGVLNTIRKLNITVGI